MDDSGADPLWSGDTEPGAAPGCPEDDSAGVSVRPIVATAPAGPAVAFSVGEVLSLLGEAVREAGLMQIWVTGTVTGLRAGPRFTTFELVEHEADGATVASVLGVGVFAADARSIRHTLALAGAELADGLELAVMGSIDLNPRYGRLRLLAKRVDPRTTLGAAALVRDELVAELARSGLLDAQTRLRVPTYPRRLGLVTSENTAGRADVFEVLGRSPVPIEVVDAQAVMSGPAAAVEVARAITQLGGAGVELIIVARGGGAKSDLAPWESRLVAMAIATCPVPVWTAVGHATDHTLADRVANAAHPTPSAAAAAVVAGAEAAVRAEADMAQRARHATELATSRRRSRRTVLALAFLVVVLALLILARL